MSHGGGSHAGLVGPKISNTSTHLTSAFDPSASGEGAGKESREAWSAHIRQKSSGSSPGVRLDTSGRGIRGLDLSGRGKSVGDPASGLDYPQQRRGPRGIDLSGRGKKAGDGRTGSPTAMGSAATLDISGHSIRGLDTSMRGKRSVGNPAGGLPQDDEGVPRRVAPERAGSAPYVIQVTRLTFAIFFFFLILTFFIYFFYFREFFVGWFLMAFTSIGFSFITLMCLFVSFNLWIMYKSTWTRYVFRVFFRRVGL